MQLSFYLFVLAVYTRPVLLEVGVKVVWRESQEGFRPWIFLACGERVK